MTAGAQSQKARRRSALAPSDNGARPFLPRAAGTEVAVVPVSGVTVLIASSSRSRDQALGLESIVDLADHRLLGGRRADAAGRRDQVRKVDGDHLVERGLR